MASTELREGESLLEGKVCSRCGEWKPFKAFRKDKERSDGLTTRCRSCIKTWSVKQASSRRLRTSTSDLNLNATQQALAWLIERHRGEFDELVFMAEEDRYTDSVTLGTTQGSQWIGDALDAHRTFGVGG